MGYLVLLDVKHQPKRQLECRTLKPSGSTKYPMRQKQDIVMVSISAVPLKPGDCLVVHSAKNLTPTQRTKLDQELQKYFWGKANTYLIVEGDFKLATATPVKT